MSNDTTSQIKQAGCISYVPTTTIHSKCVAFDYRSLYPEIGEKYDQKNIKRIQHKFLVQCSDFWDNFSQNINNVCNQYNLIKKNTDYNIYNVGNYKYTITINENIHPPCEEIELDIIITNKNNNKIYVNSYELIGNFYNTQYILPKPVDDFIRDIINKLISIIKEIDDYFNDIFVKIQNVINES
jgi:hypothetical protein